LYAGPLEIHGIKTQDGKPYFLSNLSYFLASQLKDYIGWFIEDSKNSNSYVAA